MNEYEDFRVVSSSTACRKVSAAGLTTGNLPSSSRLRYTLGEVASTNIVLDVNVGTGWTRIRLKEVPKFLIHAFNMIARFGMEVDGIFRKEGNSARLNRAEVQNIYRGVCDIPNDYTVIDVCTLVKRFLRDLKPPLLDSEEFRERLLKRGCQARISDQFVLDADEMADLFFASKERPDPLLSDVHFSTLAYVMRQMNRISAHSEQHKMSVENLALVLVASVFGDRIHNPKKSIQGRRYSQDDILAKKKQDMNVHVAAIKILITNANSIGVRPDPYVVSTAMIRSSSAMPNIRCMNASTSEVSNERASMSAIRKESSSPTPSCRRDSEPVHKILLSARKNGEILEKKQKRSSSFLPSFRDIRHRFVKQRIKSPSPQRLETGRSETTMSSKLPINDTTSSSVDQTLIDHHNESHRSKRVARNTSSTGSTASGRQSRSQQSRRGNTNAARGNEFSPNSSRPQLSKIFDQEGPLRRVSASEQNTKLSNEMISATEFLMSEYLHQPSTQRSNTLEPSRKSNRNRRHTAPVNNGLKRNRPNTVGAGLPQRRATIYTTAASSLEEKENNQTMNNSETDEEDDSLLDASKKLLEQKAKEARSRRVNLKQKHRNVSTESMMVLNGSIAKTESNTSLADEKKIGLNALKEESPQKPESMATPKMSVVNKVLEEPKKMQTFCDMATSPVIFDSSMRIPSSHENGHAWVGNKQVVTVCESPILARRQSRARLSYSKANESQLVTLPRQESNPLLSPIMKHVAQTNNSPPSQLITTTITSTKPSSPRTTLSPLVIKHIAETCSTSSIPPPIPPHSPPLLTPQSSKASIDVRTPVAVERIVRPPTPPSNPTKSSPFSPRLPVRKVNPEPVAQEFKMPEKAMFKLPQVPSIKKSPLIHQPQSLSSLRETKSVPETIHARPMSSSYHRSSENGMSPRSSEYFAFGEYSHILRGAVEKKNLPSMPACIDSRPSVATIRSNNSGMVRNRINQFQEIEQLSRCNESAMSGRMSAMSQFSLRSSDRLSDASDRASDTTSTTMNSTPVDSLPFAPASHRF